MSQYELTLEGIVIGDAAEMDETGLLVERAKSDPHAFGILFDRHHGEIFKYILHRTANVDLAQDLTSETFFKAMNKLWTFKWRNIPFSAWLYRIATNEVSGYFRKHKNFLDVPLEEVRDITDIQNQELQEELSTARDQMKKNHLFLELHQAVTRLKNKYQEVVTLRYFENKKVAEVAEILNKSEGTVKSLLHRALNQLQQLLDARNPRIPGDDT